MLITAVVTVIVAVFLWNSLFDNISGLYFLESIILSVYLVTEEIPNYIFQDKEDRLFKELLIYFSRVKHRYSVCGNISNAVMDATEGMIYEIQRLADEMYHVLIECDRKEKIREKIESQKTNRYIKLFFIQAYEASEQGNAFFAENVEHLRLDLMEEIYRKRKRRYEFSGYTFVAVVPFFAMPLLKSWGTTFTQELELFYAGTGMLLETVTFFASLLIYKLITGAREIVLSAGKENLPNNYLEGIYEVPLVKSILRKIERADGRFSNNMRRIIQCSQEQTDFGRLCFKMLLIAVSSGLLFTTFFIGKQGKEREIILGKVESIETIAPVASDEKREQLTEHILEVTKQCLQNKYSEEQDIKNALRKRIHLGNDNTEQEAVKEIQRKIQQYQDTKKIGGEMLLGILCSLGIAFMPVLKLYYRMQTIYAGAEYEVRQMQSIILMERKLQGNTVIGLLEDLEIFSRCFKRCLRRCINSYGMGTKEALLRLKEEGRQIHENFEELADAFLTIDDVGIEAAFDEVESNRRLLEKMTQLEADITMKKKKDRTDLLARIPAVLAVGAYFIVPFFLYSLKGVFEVFKLMESLAL